MIGYKAVGWLVGPPLYALAALLLATSHGSAACTITSQVELRRYVHSCTHLAR